jgi:glycosyltransferase involved in cell wall biosynthesis
MLNVEFDDLIYSLQKSGGASVYWREITSRISQMNDVAVTKSKYNKRLRGIPVISNDDVFHSSHFRSSILGKAKNVTTAHDLIYEKGLIANGIGSRLNLYERKWSYFTADAIICISENTKNDLLQIYPALKRRCPIYIVYHGTNIHLPDAISQNKIKKPNNPYLLYVGGRDGYKNFAGALEGYLLSGLRHHGVKLICTGKKFNESELKLFKSKGLEKMVKCEEHVNTQRLYELYRNAYCLLYTSSYEGFGIPPIEAMSAGCPVIASNISSIPEIVGDAGILINPFNHDDISKAILLIENDEIRNKLIDEGIKRSHLFSWDKSAESHLKVYKDITNL